MEKQYAQALKRLIAGGMDEKSAFDRLITHLRARGRMKILPQLARELRILALRDQEEASSLEVASKDEASAAEKWAAAAGVETKAVVNHDLISGWRLRHAGTLEDRSGKRALIDLYRRITAA